uniref:ELMO domain-containing protein n=1 Tax=Meloidogyne hapla TaxID=6305 RepID=A0A1I8BXP1_MELHA
MSSFHFSSKVLNFIDTRPKANELKGAVRLDPNLREYLPFGDGSINGLISTSQSISLNLTTFATFNREDQPLPDFISQLCKQFGLELGSIGNKGDICEHLVLMFDDKICFVTEKNKNLINQGIQKLARIIEDNENCQSSIILTLLNILLQLMQSFPQIFCWSDLSTQFVRKIAFFVNGQSKLEQNETRALALEMLLNISEHCEHLNECLKSEMPVDLLIRHLDNTNERVMIGSISLISSIYVLADREERINIVKLLHEKPFISAIGRVLDREENSNNQQLTKLSSQIPSQILSSEKSKLYEQLARLQQIRFDEVCALALRTPTDKEIDFLKALGDELGSTESPTTPLPSNEFYDQQTIQQQEEDWLMFRKMVQKTPPGLLSICAIIDLTQTKTPSSNENQLEETLIASNLAWNKLKELNSHFIRRPSILPQILVHLTTMLIQILGICSDSSSVSRRFGISKVHRFFRLVLQCERPFHELFRILVELFCRTWNDMNANFDEINKVYNVVQDQFERALFEDPNSLEQLEIETLRKKFSYFNMQKVFFI